LLAAPSQRPTHEAVTITAAPASLRTIELKEHIVILCLPKIPFSGFHQCNIVTFRSKLATISIRQRHGKQVLFFFMSIVWTSLTGHLRLLRCTQLSSAMLLRANEFLLD
jgi:hypothetical protein